jgi:tetratricopeptide (TPR) repeat protein
VTEPGIFREARELIRGGDRAAAVERLMAALPQLSTQFQRKAWSYAGLASYFDGHWAEALPLFQQAAAESEVPEDWFNVAMTQLHLGDIEAAHVTWQRVFELSYAYQDAPETSSFFEKKLMFAQLLFDVGASDARGLDLLERQLLPFFTNYHIADTHFWASRGVPAFQEVMTLLRQYYRALGKDQAGWAALCDRVAQAVDEEGSTFCREVREGFGPAA